MARKKTDYSFCPDCKQKRVVFKYGRIDGEDRYSCTGSECGFFFFISGDRCDLDEQARWEVINASPPPGKKAQKRLDREAVAKARDAARAEERARARAEWESSPAGQARAERMATVASVLGALAALSPR